MSDVKVTTNNVPRDVIDACELTWAERAEFDYIDWWAVDLGESSASFVRYKGELHDLGEFFEAWQGVKPSPLRAWDGYRADTCFSGLVVRYVDNSDRVIVGRYCVS